MNRPNDTRCPNPPELEDYISGRVSPRDCELISQHLSGCVVCIQALERLSPQADSLVSELQQALPLRNSQLEAACVGMLQSVHREWQSRTGIHSSNPSDRVGETPHDRDDLTAPDCDFGKYADPAARKPISLPREFGRYRLLEQLGQGGMGTVYRAWDTQLEREVALKIPQLAGTPSRTRDRFLREARAAATIIHPNVCPIYDVGEVEGTPFLTMQLVHGESLATPLKRGVRFSAEQATRIVHQLALALTEAHQRGIVHRDIKPANVLLTTDGVPLLTDFGLAQRAAPTEAELTQAGEIIGTPMYASPEQVRGDQTIVGPASDIYSLGVVLFELLTGQRPFSGTTVEVLATVLHSPPPSLTSLRPDLDPRLAAICDKALAKTVSERWESMTELAVALQEVMDAPTQPEASPQTLRARSTRRRLMGMFGGLACLAVVTFWLTDSKGAVEVRLHDHNVAVSITSESGTTYTIDRNSPISMLKLGPGKYQVQLTGDVDTLQLNQNRFELIQRGQVVVEVIPREKTPETATSAVTESPPQVPTAATSPSSQSPSPSSVPPSPAVPFSLALNGLMPDEVLLPIGQIPAWEHPNVFAELREAGTLEFPVLKRMSYVLESEITLREPECSLDLQMGNSRYRVWQRLEWDAGKSAYRCKLQRYHGRGSWTIGMKHFPLGVRLRFRFVMRDGMAVLYEGDRMILQNPSVAVEPQLRIVFGGKNATNATLHRCFLRPLTADEDQLALKLKAAAEAPPPMEKNNS